MIETKNLRLLPHTPAELLALIDSAESYEQLSGVSAAEGLREFMAAASSEYIAQLTSATSPDPWKLGFTIIHCVENVAIGMCGFKGPPGNDGIVELAYGITESYQGRGYATEAALALREYAFKNGVRLVRAHTLPERNASTSVLRKAGFIRIGEVIDPEDGRVWRWETTQTTARSHPLGAPQDCSG